MQQWVFMLSAVLAVFLTMGIGAAARWGNWLTAEADKSLIRLVVRILVPVLILKVMLGNPHLLHARNLVLPPLVGFGTVVGGFALAWATARMLGARADMPDSRQQRTFALCVGLYNYVYVPLPLAERLFGQDTVAVLFVHNLGVEIAFWTIGIVIVSGHLGGQWYKRLLNAPSVTIASALVINGLGLHQYIPGFVYQLFNLLGPSAIPLSLLLVGATIADELGGAQIRQGLKVVGLASLLRLGILPLAFMGLAVLVPGSVELKNVIVLQAAMPAAAFPVIVARHYGGDSPTALRIVLGTSLISLMTMPLWLAWGISLIGR